MVTFPHEVIKEQTGLDSPDPQADKYLPLKVKRETEGLGKWTKQNPQMILIEKYREKPELGRRGAGKELFSTCKLGKGHQAI